MKFLTHHIQNLRENWETSGLGWQVRRTAGAFVILVFIAFAACRLFPQVEDRIIDFILEVYAAADVYTEDGGLSAGALFLANLNACSLAVMYGLMPFAQYPALVLGMNAMILGVMASNYLTRGLSIVLYLAALIPHGIFEFPALVIGIGCGLFLCRSITDRVLGKKGLPPFSSCILRIAQAFLFLVTPLLALAAVAESYLTPWVITLFS
jgi:stage II sporulation protein M